MAKHLNVDNLLDQGKIYMVQKCHNVHYLVA